jgi:hypothetical protein
MTAYVRLTRTSKVLTLTNFEDEPEVESFIVPDPAGYFALEDMGDPFNRETLSTWRYG